MLSSTMQAAARPEHNMQESASLLVFALLRSQAFRKARSGQHEEGGSGHPSPCPMHLFVGL